VQVQQTPGEHMTLVFGENAKHLAARLQAVIAGL
jgi:hypothetical protein